MMTDAEITGAMVFNNMTEINRLEKELSDLREIVFTMDKAVMSAFEQCDGNFVKIADYLGEKLK